MGRDPSPGPAPGDPGPALPGAFYTDPTVYTAELAAIIERTWQAVGHETDLPDVGSRIVAHVGPHEVVVVRGEDRELRAFRNVCRHRGPKLVQQAETAEAIRRPYHGRPYRLHRPPPSAGLAVPARHHRRLLRGEARRLGHRAQASGAASEPREARVFSAQARAATQSDATSRAARSAS